MKELYERITQYEKKFSWKRRFGPIYRLYFSKLWSNLFKQGKSWIFNLLVLLPIIAGPIVAFSVDYILVDQFYALYSDIMFTGYFGIIIPLFTMYIASMMFNDEKNNRSITYLTSRPIHRFELVIIKYLCYLSIVPLFVTVATLLNYLSFGILSGLKHFDMALWFILIAFVSSAVYGAVFMLIGLLFKNPLWFGLFFVFIWEFVLASFSPTLRSLTVAYYIKSLIVYPVDGSGRSQSPAVFSGNNADVFAKTASPANALTFSTVLIIVVLISIVLSWAILQGDRLRVPYKAGKRPGGWKYYLKEVRSYIITFGIIFLTVGATFGPVMGLKKSYSTTVGGDLIMYPRYNWYTSGSDSRPSITDMGWGIVKKQTLRAKDTINVSHIPGSVSNHGSYTLALLICSEELFNEFYEDTQNLWIAWVEEQLQGSSNSSAYRELVEDYFTLAQNFVDQVNDKYTFNEYSQEFPHTTYFQATMKQTVYIMLIVLDYELVPYSEFYGYSFGFYYHGIGGRLGSYILGIAVSTFGLVLIGLAIYSLVTYSSAVEIERYEKKIAEYEAKQKNKET